MKPQFFVIMGVSGCGKSTVGKLLASQLSIDFLDGDDFHPVENIVKMQAGIPLNDDDRKIYIGNLNQKLHSLKNQNAVIACSALKETYRNWLSEGLYLTFIYLKGSYEVISERLSKRKDHFMPSQLLKSQFETLEEPLSTLSFDILLSPQQICEEIIHHISLQEFGLIGLGVMGKSLARNFAKNDITMSLYNRHVKGSEEDVACTFISQHEELHESKGFDDLQKFVNSLQAPRKIFLMIKAGNETDDLLEKLCPLLQAGDIIIDGGNSHFQDTKRRQDHWMVSNVFIIGSGVSGGEFGALNGPSLMPSGHKIAFEKIRPFLDRIAAKDKKNLPCNTYVGADGSGHFIKMIHNGIEYSEMQLISECYAYLRFVAKYSLAQISEVFLDWSEMGHSSFLLDISSQILLKKENGQAILDQILDQAGNKGTGNWTTVTATELGQASTILTSALYARYVSMVKVKSKIPALQTEIVDRNAQLEKMLLESFSLARKLNHYQGFEIIKAASINHSWDLNLSEIARVWTNGCIIRSTLMERLSEDFKNNVPVIDFENIDQNAKETMKRMQSRFIESEIPAPCFSAAFSYLICMSTTLPTANFIQAQRDFFGAHTYKMVSDAAGASYHTDWTI